MRRKLFRWPVTVAIICSLLIGIATAVIPQNIASAQGQDTISPTLDCQILDGNPLNWVGCPLITGLQTTASVLTTAIDGMLNIKAQRPDLTRPADPISNPPGLFDSPGFKTAFDNFRIIAIGMIILAGLIMVGAQALGLEIVDAYTFRKSMPRFGLAVVFMAVAWEALLFAVNLSNDLGSSIRAVIYQPFTNLGGDLGPALQVGDSGKIASTLVSLAGIFIIGLPAVLSMVATAALVVGVAFIVLLVRQMLVIMLVITSCIAIICSIMPFTQSIWKLWRTTLISMLVLPAVLSGVIAIGRVFAVISYGSSFAGGIPLLQQATAFVAFFGPFGAVPFIFARLGGALGNISGLVNNKTKGAFDRVSNFRNNKIGERYNNAKSGKGGYLGANALGAVYRRGTMGGNPLTRRGRSRYRGNVTALTGNSSDEILKRDNGRMANDDLANTLAQEQGLSRGNFIRRYATGAQAAAARDGIVLSNADAMVRGRDALGELESSYGATLGSGSMRAAAFKARAASVTGYEAGDYTTMATDADNMVQAGLITRADAVSAFKGNKARPDISGVGFGAWMNQLERTRGQRADGDPAVSAGQQEALLANALNGSPPSAIVSGRREGVVALAPRMRTNLAEANASGNNAELYRQLATIAGRYDAMAQVSPQNAAVMAEQVLGRTMDLDGHNVTIREHIERARSGAGSPTLPGGAPNPAYIPPNNDFLGMRREYGAAQAAAGAAIPTPPSDIRLKRDINLVATTADNIKIYRFKYLWSDQEYVGVMAQDLVDSHPEALLKDAYGFYMVDYAKLGMQMYTIEEWLSLQGENKPRRELQEVR